jgi:OmpA-OmpF porin, OOP family
MECNGMQRGHGLLAGSALIFVLSAWSTTSPELAAAQAAASASAPAQVAAIGGGAATQSPAPDGEPPAKPEPAQPERVAYNPGAQNSWYGSTGGVHVIDGGSGEVGTMRLQLGFDWFRAKDFLVPGDTNEGLSGVLSLSATPIEHLELFASLRSHSNSNSMGNPILLQVAGDATLGIKGYQQVLPWLSLGAEARLLLLNGIGDLGLALDGTSVGLRAAATADLRQLEESSVPLVLRANIGYLLDNSSTVIQGVENARYDSLPAATRRDMQNEDRNLVSRIERFALGINRVDMFSISLGAELPLKVATDFSVQPLLEWELGIPVNRQGYNCLSVQTNAKVGAADGCLAVTGLSATPSSLTLGVRVLPPARGLSALLAFDIGLLGSSTFVRELAPNRPWALIAAIAYAVDTRKPRPEIHYLAPAAPPVVVNEKKRIRGVVVERGFGTPIIGAVVHYPDGDFSPQLTGAGGLFTSYELDPGEVVLDVTHPDYESGRCVVQIAARAPVPPTAALTATPTPTATPAVAAPAANSGSREAEQPGFALARCELVARPHNANLLGTLTNETGNPVAGAHVELTGPTTRTVDSGAGGQFAAQDLPPGDYTARVDAADYLFKAQAFSVTSGSDVSLPITLAAKPKVSQVAMTAREVKIGTQIVFRPNSAEIDLRSTGLLSEIADVLQRNPSVKHVQVQGHTDNRGEPELNLALSQQRAESVVQWLVSAGIDAGRLEAKGFGDERPLVPNLTPDNRARNRRVQFMIIK